MTSSQKVLFVCLGNICRSPTAEAVFQHLVEVGGLQEKWTTDSAGIGGWHEGSSPDRRAQETLKNHGIHYNGTARQIQKSDFDTFDFIFGMDDENISSLNRSSPKNSKAKILLLGDFDPEGDRIIRDPYYDTGAEGFEKCYQQCMRCCKAFLEQYK